MFVNVPVSLYVRARKQFFLSLKVFGLWHVKHTRPNRGRGVNGLTYNSVKYIPFRHPQTTVMFRTSIVPMTFHRFQFCARIWKQPWCDQERMPDIGKNWFLTRRMPQHMETLHNEWNLTKLRIVRAEPETKMMKGTMVLRWKRTRSPTTMLLSTRTGRMRMESAENMPRVWEIPTRRHVQGIKRTSLFNIGLCQTKRCVRTCRGAR